MYAGWNVQSYSTPTIASLAQLPIQPTQPNHVRTPPATHPKTRPLCVRIRDRLFRRFLLILNHILPPKTPNPRCRRIKPHQYPGYTPRAGHAGHCLVRSLLLHDSLGIGALGISTMVYAVACFGSIYGESTQCTPLSTKLTSLTERPPKPNPLRINPLQRLKPLLTNLPRHKRFHLRRLRKSHDLRSRRKLQFLHRKRRNPCLCHGLFPG